MPSGSRRRPLGELWNSIQAWLFPLLEDEIGGLDEKHRQFVAVCELCAPQDHLRAYRWLGNGCPPSDRLALCKAFIAKAVWDSATTRDLIDAVRHRPALRRLCGWETLGEVPSEATFSRAFDEGSCQVLVPGPVARPRVGTGTSPGTSPSLSTAPSARADLVE